LDLYDPEWVIHTKSEERPGVEVGAAARVDGNLLCDGCRIYGQVTRSVIAPGVVVAEGAVVRDSILLTDTIVEAGAVVDRCIVDKSVRIGKEAMLGYGDDNQPNHTAPDLLNTGLTLVGRGVEIPAGAKIGRNVIIRPTVSARQFGKDLTVASGKALG
ncbi:MAG TPA: glucose-1-phosphate adenylyltransferase, partial [Roseiflexaceae bacterium]|nr:glucose-1-phosphate adenylyltransferase [Roseiflexaceae bacterium]